VTFQVNLVEAGVTSFQCDLCTTHIYTRGTEGRATAARVKLAIKKPDLDDERVYSRRCCRSFS